MQKRDDNDSAKGIKREALLLHILSVSEMLITSRARSVASSKASSSWGVTSTLRNEPSASPERAATNACSLRKRKGF